MGALLTPPLFRFSIAVRSCALHFSCICYEEGAAVGEEGALFPVFPQLGWDRFGRPNPRAPHGTPAGFSEQSKYVGLKHTGAAIAVGDFNRDRFVDLLMLDTDSYQAVSVHFWDHESFRFLPRGSGISIAGTALSKIVSAHVGDFNNDGILDVLLSDGEQGVVNFGDGNGNFNASSPLTIPDISSVASSMPTQTSPRSSSLRLQTAHAGSGNSTQ